MSTIISKDVLQLVCKQLDNDSIMSLSHVNQHLHSAMPFRSVIIKKVTPTTVDSILDFLERHPEVGNIFFRNALQPQLQQCLVWARAVCPVLRQLTIETPESDTLCLRRMLSFPCLQYLQIDAPNCKMMHLPLGNVSNLSYFCVYAPNAAICHRSTNPDACMCFEDLTHFILEIRRMSTTKSFNTEQFPKLAWLVYNASQEDFSSCHLPSHALKTLSLSVTCSPRTHWRALSNMLSTPAQIEKLYLHTTCTNIVYHLSPSHPIRAKVVNILFKPDRIQHRHASVDVPVHIVRRVFQHVLEMNLELMVESPGTDLHILFDHSVLSELIEYVMSISICQYGFYSGTALIM
jgi:hypothetical protein